MRPGGGPLESAVQIAKGRPNPTILEDTPARRVIRQTDAALLGGLRVFQKIIPDINRNDLHNYVASGFDISWSSVLFKDCFLRNVVLYLLPWFMLAFYLMQFREVANPS